MQTDVYAGYDEMGNPDYEKEDLKFQGRATLLEYLKENEEIFNLISEQVKNKLEG